MLEALRPFCQGSLELVPEVLVSATTVAPTTGVQPHFGRSSSAVAVATAAPFGPARRPTSRVAWAGGGAIVALAAMGAAAFLVRGRPPAEPSPGEGASSGGAGVAAPGSAPLPPASGSTAPSEVVLAPVASTSPAAAPAASQEMPAAVAGDATPKDAAAQRAPSPPRSVSRPQQAPQAAQTPRPVPSSVASSVHRAKRPDDDRE
jgi:hypothetical protein